MHGPEQATTALVFADDAGSLRDMIAAHKDQLARPNALWIAYPKTNRAGISRDTLWPIVAEYGLRPIGQIAMDGVWSALRFRPIREGEAPFTGGLYRPQREGLKLVRVVRLSGHGVLSDSGTRGAAVRAAGARMAAGARLGAQAARLEPAPRRGGARRDRGGGQPTGAARARAAVPTPCSTAHRCAVRHGRCDGRGM